MAVLHSPPHSFIISAIYFKEPPFASLPNPIVQNIEICDMKADFSLFKLAGNYSGAPSSPSERKRIAFLNNLC
jgi:hypothetical protein